MESDKKTRLKRLLILNPTMDLDDDNQFFLHLWINKLLPYFDKIDVISLKAGKIEENEKLEVFGLEKFSSRLGKFFQLYRWLFKKVPCCDVILTQMYPEFPMLVFPVAFIFRKPIVMYYAHSGISLRLRISHYLVKRVVTTSNNGFLIPSRKKEILGQGVDVSLFKPTASLHEGDYIVCTDRIDQAKGIDTVLKAMAEIRDRKLAELIALRIYGRRDEVFYQKMLKLIDELNLGNFVKICGPITKAEVCKVVNESLFFVSGNRVRGLSKAALEAMACAKPAVLCDEDYESAFGEYKERLYYERGNIFELAEKIAWLLNNRPQLGKIGAHVRENVSRFHNIDNFISQLKTILYDVST